jgi:hypothetical protein
MTALCSHGRRTTQGLKALLRLAPLVFLTACGPSSEQEQDMAQCRSKALKSASSTGVEGVERSCMMGKGYHFTAVLKGCGGDDPYGNAACYSR